MDGDFVQVPGTLFLGDVIRKLEPIEETQRKVFFRRTFQYTKEEPLDLVESHMLYTEVVMGEVSELTT